MTHIAARVATRYAAGHAALADRRCRQEPRLALLAGLLLMLRPALVGASNIHRPASDHRVEPWNNIVGKWVLSQQFDQRLLHSILWSATPLPRVQTECRGMGIDQFLEGLCVNVSHVFVARIRSASINSRLLTYHPTQSHPTPAASYGEVTDDNGSSHPISENVKLGWFSMQFSLTPGAIMCRPFGTRVIAPPPGSFFECRFKNSCGDRELVISKRVPNFVWPCSHGSL